MLLRLLLASALLLVARSSPAMPNPTIVFASGEGGYPVFTAPTMVRLRDGSLHVFAEARRGHGGDGAATDVGFKSSTDRGTTWSALRSIVPNGGGSESAAGSTLGNLVAFVTNRTSTGAAALLRGAPPRSTSVERVQLMFAVNNSLGWTVHSDDTGRTWSEPRDVTAQTKGEGEGWYATGPANGIVLSHGQPGRIVVPLDTNMAAGSINIDFELVAASRGRNRPCPMQSLKVGVRGSPPKPIPRWYSMAQVSAGHRKTVDPCGKITLESLFKMQQRSLALISDSGGLTWRRSAFLPLMSSETALAQLADGSILARARMAEGGWQDGCEHFARSTDFGETFARYNSTPACIDEPGVQNSMLGREHDVLLASPKTDCTRSGAEACRGNITIYQSTDFGHSWKVAVTVNHPYTEYSSMVNTGGDGVGIVYVRGRSGAPDSDGIAHQHDVSRSRNNPAIPDDIVYQHFDIYPGPAATGAPSATSTAATAAHTMSVAHPNRNLWSAKTDDDDDHTGALTTVANAAGALSIAADGSNFSISVTSDFGTVAGTYSTRAVNGHSSVQPWEHMAVVRVSSAIWRVTGASRFFNLSREIVVERSRVRVSDTITTRPRQPTDLVALGIRVSHNATMHGAGKVLNATLPGQHWSVRGFGCSNKNPDSTSRHLHRGSFGNPTVHVQMQRGGVGLLPLDDVFELHGWAWQSALARAPPLANGQQQSSDTECETTSHPSVGITDEMLALPFGAVYTQEWAIYATSTNDGAEDYWRFINRVRRDIGAVGTTIRGSGYLSLGNLRAHKEPFFQQAGYGEEGWQNMSAGQLRLFAADQGITFMHSYTPHSGRKMVCKEEGLLCHGSCVVHELPASEAQYLASVANKSTAAGLPSLMYMNAFDNAESDAGQKYRDSRIIDADGVQLSSTSCAQGQDYPAFFGTDSNSYGVQLDAYVDKALSLGFSGIYHDDFQCAKSSYTFSQWDGFSALLDPSSYAVAKLMGNVNLLTQSHEMAMASRVVKDARGQMVLNSHPKTRTFREFAQRGLVAGGDSGALLHFVETPAESRSFFTHLHTPIALNRDPGQLVTEPDPRYNLTCTATIVGSSKNMSTCVGRNVLDHLDYGVVAYLYDGLWETGPRQNILQFLFPLTPTLIGPGLIEATERLVTKHSGWYTIESRVQTLQAFLFDSNGLLVVAEHAEPNSGNMSLTVPPNGAAIIVYGQGHDAKRPERSGDAKPLWI